MAKEVLNEEEWREVDEHLFNGHPLLALALIRRLGGLGLSQASDVMHGRYGELRRDYPEKFSRSDEEYWAGWRS